MRRFACTAFLAAALTVPSIARADIPPTNSSGCVNKQAGASCQTDDGKRGQCSAAKCPRRAALPDGGFGIVDADCLLCYPSADTTSGGSSTGGSTSSGGSSKGGCNAAGGASGGGLSLGLALTLAFAWTRRRRA